MTMTIKNKSMKMNEIIFIFIKERDNLLKVVQLRANEKYIRLDIIFT